MFVRVRDPARAAIVRDELNAVANGRYRAWTKAELSKANDQSIMKEQGIGVILGFSTFMGMIIGLGITSQTLRGAVLANIKEFASLRALGVSMGGPACSRRSCVGNGISRAGGRNSHELSAAEHHLYRHVPFDNGGAVRDHVARRPEAQPTGGSSAMTINNNHGVALVARGLKKGFKVGRGRAEVLKDVDFEARHGDVTMVMGPSGSGKSTLVAALSGLLRPDAGEVVALEQ
eukprot:gene22063-26752_t